MKLGITLADIITIEAESFVRGAGFYPFDVLMERIGQEVISAIGDTMTRIQLLDFDSRGARPTSPRSVFVQASINR